MRFFVDVPLQVGDTLTLPEAVAHHWGTVLRARPGDQAVLFNGQGGEYAVQLLDLHKRTATVQVLGFDPVARTARCAVTLGLVMSKGDRLDYAIQKSTELGVRQIQLLTSERCELRLRYERDQKKLSHWQQVAVAACEQSGRNRVPQVHGLFDLSHFLAQPQPAGEPGLCRTLPTHCRPGAGARTGGSGQVESGYCRVSRPVGRNRQSACFGDSEGARGHQSGSGLVDDDARRPSRLNFAGGMEWCAGRLCE